MHFSIQRFKLLSLLMYVNRQLEIDSKFLVEQNIMDYSLLLGVHHRAPEHLRTQLVRSRSITADALESVAEDGEILIS